MDESIEAIEQKLLAQVNARQPYRPAALYELPPTGVSLPRPKLFLTPHEHACASRHCDQVYEERWGGDVVPGSPLLYLRELVHCAEYDI